MKLTNEVITKLSIKVKHGKNIDDLIDNMWLASTGVGLAAVQIGVLKRVILINTDKLQAIIINPVITKRGNQTKMSREGCLSFPGKFVNVKRHNIVEVEGFDRDWNPVKFKCRALTAFCVQHEIDHLDGVTI